MQRKPFKGDDPSTWVNLNTKFTNVCSKSKAKLVRRSTKNDKFNNSKFAISKSKSTKNSTEFYGEKPHYQGTNIKPSTSIDTCAITTSPIIGSFKYSTSPILNKRNRKSDSENEIETSPVINSHRDKIMKLRRSYILATKSNTNCVRQLGELLSDNIPTLQFDKNTTNKKPSNNNSQSNIKTTKTADKEVPSGRIQQREEETAIEVIRLQEPLENQSNITINRVRPGWYQPSKPSNNNSQYITKTTKTADKERKTTPSEEKTVIELINSQELLENKSKITISHVCPDTTYKKPSNNNSQSIIKTTRTADRGRTQLREEKTAVELITSQKLLENESKITISRVHGSKKISNKDKISSWKTQSPEEAVIEIVNSQEFPASQESAIEITESPSKESDSPENYIIESVTSQESSIIAISSAGTVVADSLESKSEESFDMKTFKPKKKYKRGTLAYRFQKLVREQKADISFWKHELYLASTSNYEIPLTEDDHFITTLKVLEIVTTYGSTVFECSILDPDNRDSEDKRLVIVNFSLLGNISFNVGNDIKVFPPYFIKQLTFNNTTVKAFVNVHKVINISELATK